MLLKSKVEEDAAVVTADETVTFDVLSVDLAVEGDDVDEECAALDDEDEICVEDVNEDELK